MNTLTSALSECDLSCGPCTVIGNALVDAGAGGEGSRAAGGTGIGGGG